MSFKIDKIIRGVKSVLEGIDDEKINDISTIVLDIDYAKTKIINLIKVHNGNIYYDLIENLMVINNQLSREWLAEMYFEYGDEEGFFKFVSDNKNINLLSKLLENSEKVIKDMKIKKEKLEEILDKIVTDNN